MTVGREELPRADLSLAGVPQSRRAEVVIDSADSALDERVEPLAEAVDEAILGPAPVVNRRLGALEDFAGMYVRHRATLAAQARRFLHDPHDVDDVVQETFLKLFLAMPEVETEAQALAFARRVLTNLCIDRYRAAQRRPATLNLDLTSSENLLAEDEPADPVVQAEDAAIVRDALSRLSPLHRAALVMREVEERSLPAIAAELGVAEDQVKHLLFRARRALRRLLVGTSVQPGVELSAAEVVSAANKRLARATMRSTNVIIALAVSIVAVAGGLQGIVRHAAGSAFVTGRQVGSIPAPADRLRGLPARLAKHRQAAASTPNRSSASSHAAVAPAQPAVTLVAPHVPTAKHAAPPKPASSPARTAYVPPVPLPAGFTVTGTVRPTGQAHLEMSDVQQPDPSTPATTATSTLTAPTAQGDVMVSQTVGLDGAVLSATLASTQVVAGQDVNLDPTTVATQEWQLPSHDILVQASAQIEDATAAAAGTLAITTVLTPTLDRVVAQHVDVTIPTPAPTGDQPTAGTAPAPAGPPAAAGDSAPAAPAATAPAEGRRTS